MRRALLVVVAGLLLAACGTATGPPPLTLRVLAGSELADMAPVLDEAAEATGVRLELQYTGTLEGADTVAAGRADGTTDALWFSSNRYLETIPAARDRVDTATRIMGSPVVLGVRAERARELGWDRAPVTWSQVAEAASTGRFAFGMTDPSSSNSGFSALVAVAAALDGSGRVLDPAAVDRVTGPLAAFFAGQRLTSGSSGWLTDAYVRRATGGDGGPPLDGVVTYEASILELNRSGRLPEPLTLVVPSDGVVSAEYPLTLLRSASPEARAGLARLTEHLRRPEVQQRIVETTARRAGVPGVAPPPEAARTTLVELPFPTDKATLDALLTTYLDRVRRPARTVYVLDVSGSMQGTRIDGLRTALIGLTGSDPSLTNQFRRFRSREDVVFVPFSDAPGAPEPFSVDPADPQPSRDAIATRVRALAAGGNTAVYGSLEAAYRYLDQAAAADPDRLTTVVLLSDGESNRGPRLPEFRAFLAGRPPSTRGVPVFPILFGEAARGEMEQLAAATGGRTFAASDPQALDAVFREIRGYQ
ncbi:VWA domain-containing protein [Actinomycetospora aeridis]|uniref:VWA domain-containing protein n=1 Tax=Actinomycetospora aeridis TaxID=3129231 RepID=A0ABU8N6W6_9PSEU